MSTDTQHHNSNPTLGRINSVLTLVLTAAVALILIGIAIQVGSDVVDRLQPEQAEAAPVITATPTAQPTTQTDPAETRPTAVPTAAPPTWTPTPTVTLEPTPVPPTPTPTPVVPRVVVDVDVANVRRGPGRTYEKIDELPLNAEVEVTGWYNDWWRIDFWGQEGYIFGELVTAHDVYDDDAPINGPAVAEVPIEELPGPTLHHPVTQPKPIWAIDEDHWIDVDLSEQRVTAYEGQTPVKTYLVSTGLPWTPTPEGQFRIWVKFRYDDMEGDDYFLEDVPYVMYFHEGYGFHGVWWHANWGNPMSHGCINQPNEMAAWLFEFSEIGTLVNIRE